VIVVIDDLLEEPSTGQSRISDVNNEADVSLTINFHGDEFGLQESVFGYLPCSPGIAVSPFQSRKIVCQALRALKSSVTCVRSACEYLH